MEPGTVVFLSLVGLLGLGLLWFHVIRPMLEAFGILGTGEYSVTNEAPIVSSVYVAPPPLIVADEQTDEQTDVGPSALQAAINAKQIDVIRDLIIDILVSEGADVDTVRQSVKGDGGVIGAKVAAARERLGITPPARKILTRDNGGPVREMAFD